MRYIDAYEVKRQIQKATEGEVDVMKVFLNAMYRIDKIPTADVRENAKGKWIQDKHEMAGYGYFDCSVCGADFYEIDGFNFCPNCGAQMRGDNDV